MIRSLVFLVPLFLCSCYLTLPCMATRDVRIAAIINTDSRVGREQMVALKMAARDFNSSTSAVIFLNFASSNSSDPLKELITVQNFITWGADAIIISTGTWPDTLAVAKLASRSNVPVLSLTAPAAAAPFALLNPYLLQMSYPASPEVRCIAKITNSYNWRRVVVIYEDDDCGCISGAFALLSNALRDHGLEIDYHVAFPSLDRFPDPKGVIRHKLRSIPGQMSKVFVVLRSSRNLTINLLQVAKELKLMEDGHVWIVGDDVAALVDSTLSPSFLSDYMQGVIAVKTYVNKSAGSYVDFTSKFRNDFRSEYENQGEQYFDPGVHAVRAYDAVSLIARSAASTARMGTKQTTMIPAMLSSDFTGLSGRIAFGRNGTLREGKGHSAYRVLNVVGRSYRELGFWLDGYGFYKDEGELRRRVPAAARMTAFGSVYWPGGRATGKFPAGWGKLKIGLPSHTTFEQFVKAGSDENGVDHFTGFCIDVFNEIVKNLEYDLNFEYVRFNRSDYDDLVNQVTLMNFDAVVGDITILAKRMENVTLTQPYLSSGLSMMVPVKVNDTTWMLTKTFSKEVWLTILATILFTTLIVWYLEHGSNNPDFDGSRTVQLGATFWLIVSTIFFTHGRISGNYTKVVVAVWLLVVLILTTCFTANLSSILTLQKLEPRPPGSTVGCDGDSFVVKYLGQALGYTKEKITKIRNVDDYTKAFQVNNISAAYMELPYLKVFLSQHDDFTVYGELYRLGGFGFVFPKGSPLADDFSRVILQLAENGTLKDLESKWFKFQLTVSPGPNNDRQTDDLTLRSLWELFVLTVGTSTVVCAIFKIHSLFLIHGNSMKLAALRESFKRLTDHKVHQVRPDDGQGDGASNVTTDYPLRIDITK